MLIVRNLLTRDRSVVVTQPGRDAALLVLPGFGTLRADWPALAHAYASGPYDVYLPDYFARDSIEACVANLHGFIAVNGLHRYPRVNVFAYILGGWVLNRYLQQHPLPNLHRVIYDRSPLQDLAPRAVTDAAPLLARWVLGRVLADLAQTPYPPLAHPGGVGLMIENGVTSLMRLFRRYALSARPLTWGPEQFGQPHDDYCYVPLNHDEMYTDFPAFMGEVQHFYAHGRFSEAARRVPYTDNPYKRL